jgi:hypothetical protein
MYHTHPFFTHDSVLCTAYMGSTSSLLAHSADILTMESLTTACVSMHLMLYAPDACTPLPQSESDAISSGWYPTSSAVLP